MFLSRDEAAATQYAAFKAIGRDDLANEVLKLADFHRRVFYAVDLKRKNILALAASLLRRGE